MYKYDIVRTGYGIQCLSSMPHCPVRNTFAKSGKTPLLHRRSSSQYLSNAGHVRKEVICSKSAWAMN